MNTTSINNLQKEIYSRKKEVKNGDVLTHDEIWKLFNNYM